MKALLVALQDQEASDPSDALLPGNAAGLGRLIQSLIISRLPTFTATDNLKAFDRSLIWPDAELPDGPHAMLLMRAVGERRLEQAIQYLTVVVFGARAWYALTGRKHPEQWFSSRNLHGTRFYYFPMMPNKTIYGKMRHRMKASRVLSAIAYEALHDAKGS